MAHIIPSVAKKQITSYPRERIPDKYWDPIGTVLPDPRTFCLDENGVSDPLVTNFTLAFTGNVGVDNTITTDLPRGKRIRLLNVDNGDAADQRVDFFLANQGCEDATYSVYVTGRIESFNADEFEIISGRINGGLLDWGGYTISENIAEGANGLRTHTVPAGTFHIASKFGNRNSGGSEVNNNGITWDVNVPAGPCVVTQITFHAANSDDKHNEITTFPASNVYYDLTIERQ